MRTPVEKLDRLHDAKRRRAATMLILLKIARMKRLEAEILPATKRSRARLHRPPEDP